jgi:hypothetical protein
MPAENTVDMSDSIPTDQAIEAEEAPLLSLSPEPPVGEAWASLAIVSVALEGTTVVDGKMTPSGPIVIF